MSTHAFDPKCPDCRPVLVDPDTGRALPNDHPAMVVLLRVFDESSRADQEAFHRVTVQCSRDPEDLRRMQGLMERFDRKMLS